MNNATKHAELNVLESLFTQKSGLFSNGSFNLEVTVYVTCEPCIMCTDLLNKVKVKRVVFGCKNDKFGGCGGTITPINDFEVQYLGDNPKTSKYQTEAITLLQEFYDRSNPNSKKLKA